MMSRLSHFLLCALLLSTPACAGAAEVDDAFSPQQGATALILRTIAEAHQSIRVAAHYFSSLPIAEALVKAHRKGIDVRMVLDKSQDEGYSLATFMRRNGIPVRINSLYAIMHDKFTVIDGGIVELGSFNYTGAAEDKNAENVLVLRDMPHVVGDYAAQWNKLWSEGE